MILQAVGSGIIEPATPGSACFDLICQQSFQLSFGEIKLIHVDLETAFSDEYVALVLERSGLAMKGLDVKAGVIDSDYRGQWGVVLRYLPSFRLDNEGRIDIGVNPKVIAFGEGQKIAQVLISKRDRVELSFVTEICAVSERGEKGFGSSG